MLAYSVQKDFNEAMSIGLDPALPAQERTFKMDRTLDEVAPTLWTAQRKDVIMRNTMAMSSFFVAFQKAPDCRSVANKTKTLEWPYGRSHIAGMVCAREHHGSDATEKRT